MEDIQHLIQKFWAGKLTTAEKQQLFNYMNNDEAVWKEQLEQEFANNSEELLSAPASERVLQGLRAQIKGRVIPMWSRWAAAAMVLIIAGTFFVHKERHPLAMHAIPAKQLLQHRNAGSHMEIMTLSDSSEVQLQPGSTISYYTGLERTLSLEGTALFKVAKDMKRPFSVTAKGFTTTALGTTFSISTTQSEKLSVKLLEGKVVVRAARGSDLVMKDMYLTPGQEFVVNTTLKQFHVENAVPSKAVQTREHIVIMSFNKTSLQEVFAQLGTYYKVQFDVDTAATAGLSFTGSFEQSDALQVVLSAICNMNDLTFSKEGKKIIISKQQ